MDSNDFQEKILLIDAELAQKKVPVHERAFQAFGLVAPNYNGPLMSYGLDRSAFGEYEGPNLLAKIHNWYKQAYGKRASAARDLGRIPVIIKEDIYLIRIPLIDEASQINVLPLISGLTPAVARRLSAAELDEIDNKFMEGFSLAHKFEDLYSQPETSPFLDSAMEDKDAAVDCLEEEADINGAVFHSRGLAENMLKAVLLHITDMSAEDITKKYDREITDIYREVSNYAKFPAEIITEINNILQYQTDIGDSGSLVANSDAVKAFWAALRIAGFCATLLLEHEGEFNPDHSG
jgi:hypothetical protein